MESDWKTYSVSPRYKVSREGLVYDTKLDRYVSQQVNTDGYRVVTIRLSDNSRKTCRVHRLVAECFLEPVEGKGHVNHKSGDKADNSSDNLEWCTHSENIQHAWDTGLLKSTPARSHKLSAAHKGKKIGAENPKSRRVLCVNTGEVFESITSAASQYGIDVGGIAAVCAGGNAGRIRRTAGKHPATGESLVWRYED